MFIFMPFPSSENLMDSIFIGTCVAIRCGFPSPPKYKYNYYSNGLIFKYPTYL